jgi:hypothetical protein
MPNNPNPIPTSVNLSLQQLIVITTNIPPIMDAPSFATPVGEFVQDLKLEFLVKVLKKICTLHPSLDKSVENSSSTS